MNQLKVAAILAGNGKEILDALKVIDEKGGTPAGAQTVRDIRYELSPDRPAIAAAGRSHRRHGD